jgi:uncharacterized protein
VENGNDKAFPGLGQSIALLVILTVVDIATSLLLDASGLLPDGTKIQAMLLATSAADALVLAAFLGRRRLTWWNALHPAQVRPQSLMGLLTLPLLLISPALFLASGLMDDMVRAAFPISDRLRQLFDEVFGGGAASFAAVVLVAPFFEELLFRGIILRGLLARMSAGRAVVLSSLLFGAMHANIYQFVDAGALGLVLGWLYVRFRSTLPCIVLHAVTNALAMLCWSLGAQDLPTLEVPGWIWFASALAVVPGIVLLKRYAAYARAGRADKGPETIEA